MVSMFFVIPSWIHAMQLFSIGSKNNAPFAVVLLQVMQSLLDGPLQVAPNQCYKNEKMSQFLFFTFLVAAQTEISLSEHRIRRETG